MKSITRHLWASVLISLFTDLSVAGTSAGLFSVSITLSNTGFVAPPVPGMGVPTPRSGVCISETLSEQTNALVRVACATGQFVSITPLPGKRFLGTHGGAFRYSMGAGAFSAARPGAGNPYMGTGTVTALRIYNASGSDEALEMLVSF